MSDNDLKNLEDRIDALIAACARLKSENHSLRSEKDNLTSEHTRLVKKTQVARDRIESMIERLKTLERE